MISLLMLRVRSHSSLLWKYGEIRRFEGERPRNAQFRLFFSPFPGEGGWGDGRVGLNTGGKQTRA